MTSQQQPERRLSIRVDVHDLRVVDGPPIRIRNISPSGMLFNSPVVLKVGRTYNLGLDLPGERSALRLKFVVFQRDDPTQDQYRAVFAEPDQEALAALERFVRDSLLVRDLEGLMARYPRLADESLNTITGADRVLALLADLMKSNRPLVATGRYLEEPIEVYLQNIEVGEPSLLVGSRRAARFLLGSTIVLSLSVEGRSYLFETAIVQTGQRHFRVLKPRLVFYTDKRMEPRRALEPGTLTAIIPLPYPEGATRELRVLDRSPGGMALEYPQENYPLPGTPIPSMRLHHGAQDRQEEVGPVYVRHISPHPEGIEGMVRVGMQTGSVDRTQLVLGRTDLPNGRPRRPSTAKTPAAIEAMANAPEPPARPGQLFDSRIVSWYNSKDERLVGRLDTTSGLRHDRPVPVVIIPPAAAKTKETLVGLSLTLVDGFASVGQELAVLRFDGIRRRGESHRDGEWQPLGSQMLDWNHSQGISDIWSALDYVRDNPNLSPSHVVLLTFSGASLEARRLLAEGEGRDVTLWISCLGVPEFREAARRLFGGLDVVELERMGMLPERLQAFGEYISASSYVRDAIARELVGMEQARRDLASIRSPVCWFYGQHDGWVDIEQVQDLMTVKAESGAGRELFQLNTGHNLRTSQQAQEVFRSITEVVLRTVTSKSPAAAYFPTSAEIETLARREAERVKQCQLPNGSYWRQYLLGAEGEVGYDVMCEADDYDQFMHQQAGLLRVADGDVVADLGTGTGNLMQTLVRSHLGHATPSRLVLSDLVPEVLEVARTKVNVALMTRGIEAPIQTEVVNLEHSRLEVVRDYIEGRLYGPLALVGRVAGFGEAQLERLYERYDQLTHDVMRGHWPGADQLKSLKRRHEPDVLARVLEFSRAARLVRGQVRPADLPPRATMPADSSAMRAADLRIELLDFGDAALEEAPLFADNSFDRIASSLVLCYLNEPAKVVRRLFGLLRPGGRIVTSTPRPDMDISLIFTRLISHLEQRMDSRAPELMQSARTFSNDAALLLDLEEQGFFHMPDGDRLKAMFEQAGFEKITLHEGFGDPPQAIIVAASKPR